MRLVSLSGKSAQGAPLSRVEFVCSASVGAKRAVIEVRRDGQVQAETRLTAQALDTLIADLSDIRAVLADPVSVDFDAPISLKAVPNPRWRAPEEDQHDGRVLALRHPGLGWLAFVFPHAEAVQIARWLVHGSDKKLSSKSPDKPKSKPAAN